MGSGGGGRQARGPADRPRRADTFTGNARPSSGTVSARPGRTRPHHIDPWSRGGAGGGAARRGQSPEGPAFRLTGSLHPPPPRLRRERPTTPRGEHLTRGAEPTGRGSSQPPPGAHSGGEGRRGQKTRATSPPPPSGRVSQTTPRRSRRPGPGGRLQRRGPNRAPAGGPEAQSPACVQRPTVLGGRHQRRPCQHLPGGKKGLLRATK